MLDLVGAGDDHADGLTGDAVLVSREGPDFSGTLVQGGVWPPSVDARAPRLILQRQRDRPRILSVNVDRSVIETLTPVIQRAAELALLPRGWNSYDASPVSGTALHRTLEFLLEYVASGVDHPAVVPTVRGGLQLEWHDNGVDVEVEMTPEGSVSFFAEDGTTGETDDANLTGNEDRMRQWLTRASGQSGQDDFSG